MRLNVSTPDETIGELDPAPMDLSPVIETLKKVDGSMLTLDRAAGETLQAIWYEGQGFYIECQEPDAEATFHTVEHVSPEVATAIVLHFRAENPAFREQCEWALLKPLEPEGDEGDGFMGYFEGVGLRHVLNELERNGVSCRVEVDRSGFQVFVPPENDSQGRALIAALFPVGETEPGHR